MRNLRKPLSDGGGLSLVSESPTLRGEAHAQSSRGFSMGGLRYSNSLEPLRELKTVRIN